MNKACRCAFGLALHAPSSPARWRPTPVGFPHSSRPSMPMRMSGDGVLVGAPQVARGPVPAEFPRAIESLASKRLPQFTFVQNASDGGGERFRIIGIDQKSRIADHLWQRAGVGGH